MGHESGSVGGSGRGETKQNDVEVIVPPSVLQAFELIAMTARKCRADSPAASFEKACDFEVGGGIGRET